MLFALASLAAAAASAMYSHMARERVAKGYFASSLTSPYWIPKMKS